MKKYVGELRDDVELKDPTDPLSAVGKWDRKPVYKFSYNPKTGKLLYSYPGENHADAVARAGDTKHFDDYVRVIYDANRKVAGSRVYGTVDYDASNEKDKVKSFEAQYITSEFFKQFDSTLKWVLDLSNNDLSRGVEALDLTKISKQRILEDRQMKELFKSNLESKTVDVILKHLQE